MKLTRDEIIGGDFAQDIDGWHRGDVLRHLNAIAAAVEALQEGTERVVPEEDEHARREAQELLAAARAESNTIRAQAADDAERQVAQAQLAVKDLLERVASLNLGLEEARRTVEQRGTEMARRLEQSAEPFVGAMRDRAEALGAEVELMATGLAVSARATAVPEARPEERSETETAPEAETQAEAQAPPEREPEAASAPEAEPGTGLSPGDLDEAAAELAADATPEQDDQDPNEHDNPAEAGRERARLVALNMALGGAPEKETERRLREEFDIDDPAKILEAAYGGAREGR